MPTTAGQLQMHDFANLEWELRRARWCYGFVVNGDTG
jgi:hypothetical protein